MTYGRCGDRFAASLGSSRSGRLRFMGGAHRITIEADPHLWGLYSARFGHRTPKLTVRGGVVAILFPGTPTDDWLDYRSERAAKVVLNARRPWEIEVRGGASRLRADLRYLKIGSFRLEGGVARPEVALPGPAGTVEVVFLGGVSNVSVSRPEGVAVRLRVEGGVTGLTFDERRIGVAGDRLELESAAYDGAADRYEMFVAGGANNLNIGEHQGGRGRS
jgi:hypothetical protein